MTTRNRARTVLTFAALVVAGIAILMLPVADADAGLLGIPQVITGDADSGIGGTGYTHAVNSAGGALSINLVPFEAGGTSGGN